MSRADGGPDGAGTADGRHLSTHDRVPTGGALSDGTLTDSGARDGSSPDGDAAHGTGSGSLLEDALASDADGTVAPEEPGAHRVRRAASGRRTIAIVAAVAVVMAGAGFFAASLVISPEDAAARTAAPVAGPITVPVERKALDATVVTRGDIGFSGSVEVSLSGASGALVVTGRLPEVGAEVPDASVLLEVTGRPVIALSGVLPAYRSLTPGVSGPDVEQLETSLARMGLDPGPQDKVYDAATGAAVAQLYRNLGYEPPAAAAEAQAALDGAGQELAAAVQARTDAGSALTRAQAGPPQSTRLGLQGAVDGAKAAWEAAKVTPSAPDPAAVARASSAVDRAQVDLGAATNALETAVASGQEDLGGLQAAVDDAQGSFDAAQRQLDAVNAGGPPSQASVAAARNAYDVALAQRDEGLKVDASAEQAAVAAADARVTAAQAAVAAAQAAAGTPLPAQEIVWLADLPRRVDEVLVGLGSTVDKTFLRVSAADLSVRASVSAQEAGLLTVGMPAELTVPGSPAVPAVVSEIGAADQADQGGGDTAGGDTGGSGTEGGGGSTGQSSSGTTVVLQPQGVDAEQARALRGANVKVTIPVATTDGEVLVVPVAALFSDAGGTPRVEVARPDGTTRFQPVRLGLSAGGEVEIGPVDDAGAPVAASADTVQSGSLVVVGR